MDALRACMYVTSGYPGAKSDLWRLDLSSAPPRWTLLAPATVGPGDRIGASLVHDPVRNRLLLMGGSDARGAEYFADVWQFRLDGAGSWERFAIADTIPPARKAHSAVYDPARDRLLIVGGQTPFIYLDDVWSLELAGDVRWRRLGAAGPSPGRRSNATVFLDSPRDRLIRFGGHTGASLFNDLWAFDLAAGGGWSPLSPIGLPPSIRAGMGGEFDANRGRAILYGGYNGGALGETFSLDLGDTLRWQRLSASSPPGALQFATLVRDTPRDRMLLFGGCSGDAYPQRTWGFDCTTEVWSDLRAIGTPETPTVRADHAACVDRRGGRVFLVGGYEGDNGTGMGDLWRLDLAQSPVWSQVTLATPLPSGSRGAVVLFDELGDRLVHMGDARGVSSQTWSLPLSPGGTWTPLLPPGALPPPQEERGAAYDPIRHRAIVVGSAPTGGWQVWALPLDGYSSWVNLTSGAPSPQVPIWGSSSVYDAQEDELVVVGGLSASEVWAMRLDTPSWRRLYAGPGPPVRGEHSVTLDGARRRILLTGGYAAGQYLSDIWEFQLAGAPGWRQLTPGGASPLPRGFHATVYDAGQDRLVLFGGHNGGFLGDTWYLEFGAPTPVLVSMVEARAGATTAEITWQVDDIREYLVERHAGDGVWREVWRATPDGLRRIRIHDTGLTPGRDYSYRLGWKEDGAILRAGEVTLRTMATRGLQLLGVRHPPGSGAPEISVHIPFPSMTTLEVFDLAGRCLVTRALGPLPVGDHDIAIPGLSRTGLYLASVVHAGVRVSGKLVLLR